MNTTELSALQVNESALPCPTATTNSALLHKFYHTWEFPSTQNQEISNLANVFPKSFDTEKWVISVLQTPNS